MAARVGQAYVDIVADGDGIEDGIVNAFDDIDYKKIADRSGQEFADRFEDRLEKQLPATLRRSIGKNLEAAISNEKAIKDGVEAMLKDVTEMDNDINRVYKEVARRAGVEYNDEFRDTVERATVESLRDTLHKAARENGDDMEMLGDLLRRRMLGDSRDGSELLLPGPALDAAANKIRALIDEEMKMREDANRLNMKFDSERAKHEEALLHERYDAEFDEIVRIGVEKAKQAKREYAAMHDRYDAEFDEVVRIGVEKAKQAKHEDDLLHERHDAEFDAIVDQGKQYSRMWNQAHAENHRYQQRLARQLARAQEKEDARASKRRMDLFSGVVIGRMLGAGSRNNFLNFIGRTVGNITGLLTGAIKGVGTLVSTFMKGFRGVAEGASTLTKIMGGMSAVGSAAVTAMTTLAVALPALAIGLTVAYFAASALVSALSALAALATAMIGTIAAGLTGALLVAGGALTALAGAGGLLAAAFISMNKEQKKALSQSFKPLGKEFKSLGRIMMKDMVPAFKTWSENLQDAVKLARPVAKVMGAAFAEAGNTLTASLSGPGFQKLAEMFGVYLPSITTNFTSALGNFMNGLAGMFAAVMPHVERFAIYLNDVTQRFADWAASAEGQNAIVEFTDKALDSLKSLWDFTREFTGWVIDVLFSDQALGAGNNIFDALADRFAGFREDIERFAADGSLQNWFDRAIDFAGDLEDLISGVRDFWKELDDDGTLDKLGDALSAVGSGISAVSDAIGGIKSAMSTVLPALKLLWYPFMLGFKASKLFYDFVMFSIGGWIQFGEVVGEAFSAIPRAVGEAMMATLGFIEDGINAGIDLANKMIKTANKVLPSKLELPTFGNVDFTPDFGRLEAFQTTVDRTTSSLETYVNALAMTPGPSRGVARAAQSMIGELEKLPHDTQLHIQTVGFPKTVSELTTLVSQVELTPKQIKMLAEIGGIELSKAQLRTLKDFGSGVATSLNNDLGSVGDVSPSQTFSLGLGTMIGAAVGSVETQSRGIKEKLEGAGSVIMDSSMWLGSIGSAVLEGSSIAGKGGEATGLSMKLGYGVGFGGADSVWARLSTSAAAGASLGAGSAAASGGNYIGMQMKYGFSSGFAGADGLWAGSVRSAVGSAIAAGRAAAAIASPSKKTAEIGRFLGEGLVVGMSSTEPKVAQGGRNLSATLIEAMAGATIFGFALNTGKSVGAALGLGSLKGLEDVFKGGGKKAAKKWARSLIDVPSFRSELKKTMRGLGKESRETFSDVFNARDGDDAISSLGSLRDSLRSTGRDSVRDAQANLNSAAENVLSAKGKKARKKAIKEANQAVRDFNLALKNQARAKAAANIVAAQMKTNEKRIERLVTTGVSANATLADYAEARARVAEKIEKAQDALQDAIDLKLDYASSVSDSAKAFASIASAQAAVVDGITQDLTANDIVGTLTDRLGQIKQFQENLRILLSMGLGDEGYKQLVDMGVENGSAYVEALIAGGAGAVGQVNSLLGAIGAESDALGEAASSRLYQAGIDTAQGFLDGLLALEGKLETAAESLGNAIANQIKKTLGIKSPSRVAMSLMGYWGDGLVAGLDAQQGRVGAASSLLAGKVAVSPEVAAYDAQRRLAGTEAVSGNQTTHQWHITTPTEDPKAVASEMMNEMAGRIT